MRGPLVASGALHVALLVVALVGFAGAPEPLEVGESVTVEIVTLAPDADPADGEEAGDPAELSPLPERQAASPPPPAPPPTPVEERVAAVEPAPPPPAPAVPDVKAEPAPPPKTPAPKIETTPAAPAPPVAGPKQAAKEPAPEPTPPRPATPVAPAPRPAAQEAPPPPAVVAQEQPAAAPPAPVARPKPVVASTEREPERAEAAATALAEDDPLAALLRSIENTPQRVRADAPRPGTGSTVATARGEPGETTTVVAAAQLSALGESIRRQVQPCWKIPIGLGDLARQRTELAISLARDGSVLTVDAADAGRMERDPAFRIFTESAMRAVRSCAPLRLPQESYRSWQSVIIAFEPHGLAG